MIELSTATFLMDIYKHSKDLNGFLPVDVPYNFELKDEAVTMKMNVIYFDVDTISTSSRGTNVKLGIHVKKDPTFIRFQIVSSQGAHMP